MKKTKNYGLSHIAIAMTDPDRALKFYQKVFDVQVLYHQDDFLQVTTPGANDVIVFEKNKDDPGTGLDGRTVGITHFGFSLKRAKDIGEMEKRITSAGGGIIDKREFAPGAPYIFFKDPDGYKVEVRYELVPE